jgi:hypothetical protein
MIIVGVDYPPSVQQVAFLDTKTGETGERRLNHSDGEAELPIQGVRSSNDESNVRSERWLGRTEFRPKDYMRTLVGNDEFVQPKRNETAPRSECCLTFKNALTQPKPQRRLVT